MTSVSEPVRKRAAARDQLVAQLDVVEDLAVEGDRRSPSSLGHRLLAIAEVDDRQARMAEPGRRRGEDALLIRAAMRDGGHHPLKESFRIPDRAEIAAKTAHAEIFPNLSARFGA